MALTLNYPFNRARSGNTATVIPGCDGKPDTYTSKFANFVNWGRCRTIIQAVLVRAWPIGGVGLGWGSAVAGSGRNTDLESAAPSGGPSFTG